ncbi:MAG: purine-nucleoside phosphorylase [Clostridia bacterium]|nr:purine-nucleoside phosphorylase [Clostridia bacterium]MDD4798616.1 purine-nucleoside phosphorylase [Clostridia bacterium]
MTEKNAVQIKINEATGAVEKELGRDFDLAIILGSGLGKFAEKLQGRKSLSYEKIPHFCGSTVQGHAGRLSAGVLSGKKVLMMEGRFHYYEGHEMAQVTLPIRVMQQLGIPRLIVTNAAGGVNKSFHPGQLMLICDHINTMGINPLRGANLSDFGVRFPDLSEAYDQGYRNLARQVAEENKIDLVEGVYAYCCGPSYETPAEVRFYEKIGVDAVGMSTVPEVIVARHGGMRVLGLSCITNAAAGVTEKTLNHQEVMEAAAAAFDDFTLLLREFVRQMD